RRRHTRFSRDWSSDVCSSDLELYVLRLAGQLAQRNLPGIYVVAPGSILAARLDEQALPLRLLRTRARWLPLLAARQLARWIDREIGRASCRERVSRSVVARAR